MCFAYGAYLATVGKSVSKLVRFYKETLAFANTTVACIKDTFLLKEPLLVEK